MCSSLLYKINLAVLAFCFFYLTSCLEELGDSKKIQPITVTPIIPAPVALKDKISLQDFMDKGNNTHFKVVDKTIVLVYSDTLYFDKKGEDLFAIPDQDFTFILNSPNSNFGNLPIPVGEPIDIPLQEHTVQIDTEGSRLDSIVLKEGTITIIAESDVPVNAKIIQTFSSIKKADGTALEKTFSFNGVTASRPISSTVNMAGTRLYLTKNGVRFNIFKSFYRGTLTGKGEVIVGKEFKFRVLVQDLKFKIIYGEFNNTQKKLLEGKQRMFEERIDKNSVLVSKSPSVLLSIDNSFGIPFTLNVENLTAINTYLGGDLALSGNVLQPPNNPYILNFPNQTQKGTFLSTDLTINTGNSNIKDIVSSFPASMTYRFGLEFGSSSGEKSFVLDTSSLRVRTSFTLPFYGHTKNVFLTKKYKIGSLWEGVQKATLKIDAKNTIPISFLLQVYLEDDNKNIIDSIFVVNKRVYKIPSAFIDKNGFSTEPSMLNQEYLVSKVKMEKLRNTRVLSIKITMTSSNNGDTPIKVKPEDALELQITSRIYTQLTL